MSKTVVGLFNTNAQANDVKEALIADGYESRQITIHANNTAGEDGQGEGIGDRISHFFKSLTGGDDDVHEHYATGVNAGGALLAITVDDMDAPEVAAMLKQHGARDIDGNSEAAEAGTPVYGGVEGDRQAFTNAQTAELTDRTAIPVVEESLVVGKREVDRGGVRVYSHVVEQPVSADVTLRDEVINVERRFVDRPATAADFAAGSGAVLELDAMGEEAVVGKTSRVVEEVVIGKQVGQHTETVHDTLRKTEVDLEDLTTGAAGTQTVRNDVL